VTDLVLATANPYKVREVEPHFRGTGVRLLPVTSLVPDWTVDETGATLVDNARLKARAAMAATGRPAAADDTGLFVEALDGAPGVRSSRYAGMHASYADNIEKLLVALRGLPAERRGAQFRTVVVLVRPDGAERVFEGVLEGRILEMGRGRNGFGYDPVFLAAGQEQTLAEMPLAEKNRMSHRARAFASAAAFLASDPAWVGTKE
jgi:XTP/dITP diphosphohydrolase